MLKFGLLKKREGHFYIYVLVYEYMVFNKKLCHFGSKNDIIHLKRKNTLIFYIVAAESI